MNNSQGRCRLAVDVGGTFTDVALELGAGAGGGVVTAKVLTTPHAPEVGVVAAVREAVREAGIEPGEVDLLIHGTTLATNALIERTGAKTALLVTEGFRDSLEMALENRFEQYDISIDRPAPLVPRHLRWPVSERMNYVGEVLVPLDEDSVHALLPRFERHGIEAVAVGLLHSYANPVHERRVGEILADALPELRVTLSSEVCPEIREYERQSTACANAYVQPRMSSYLTRLESELRSLGLGCPLLLMTSGGGLTTLDNATRFPIRLVESGPAGGAILASEIARECGSGNAVSFDMGGTTAKICPHRWLRAADDPHLRGGPGLPEPPGERSRRSAFRPSRWWRSGPAEGPSRGWTRWGGSTWVRRARERIPAPPATTGVASGRR